MEVRLGNNSHSNNQNVAFWPQANQAGLFLNPKRVKGELTPFADELRNSRVKNPEGVVEAKYTVVEDARTRLNRERVQEQQKEQSHPGYKANFGPQNDPRVIDSLQKQIAQMGQRLNRLEQLLTKNSNKTSAQASYDAWGNRNIGNA